MLTSDDRLEIQELVARYAWSLDTGDEDAFLGCFTAAGELTWDVFDTPGTWRGEAALRRFVAYFRARPETAGRQHHVSNLCIDAQAAGDARGRAYVLVAIAGAAAATGAAGPTGANQLGVMGWYEDHYVREDGRWRIARRVIRDWSGPVLARLAGQDGTRRARARPPALDGLWATQDG